MTASRLDELSVHDFDDAAEHADLTVDIRSGVLRLDVAVDDEIAAPCTEWAQMNECKVCGAMPASDGWRAHGRGCFENDSDGGGSDYIDPHYVCANASCARCRGPRLARGTEPGMASAVAHAIEHGHAEVLREDGSVRMVISIPPSEPDPHLDYNVALHEALTALLSLESVITRNGGHLWPQDQESLFAARRLLERHGRR